jgi:predicted N-formylglutamate amidohydrolase
MSMSSAVCAPPWPAAVEVLNEWGRSPFVLICEHASNYIPDEYHQLGLQDRELTRHIAWDIGAANVTRALAKRIG